MKPKTRDIADRMWKGQQSINRELLVEVHGPLPLGVGAETRHRFRFTVHVDSYDFQSYAKAERWDGAKWQTVHVIPGEQLATKASHHDRQSPTQPSAFDADLDELRRVAFEVVL